MEVPAEGTTYTVERTFTREDVEQFGAVSGDTQERHTEPDEDGRVMVQGLLTATLPTEIGGDLDVLASTMDLDFMRPVYTGERITCTCTVEHVEHRDDRLLLTMENVCRNEDDEVVLTSLVEGQIFTDG